MSDLGECQYRERDQQCPDPAAYRVQFDGKKYVLCERHCRREYHPPDLHKKLPGLAARTARKIARELTGE